MRYLVVIFLFLFIAFCAQGQNQTVNPGGSPFVTDKNPGDSVFMNPGTYTGFTMNNSTGHDTLPVVVINNGGWVRIAGPVTMNNNQHVEFSGAGSPDHYYGIRIDSIDGPAMASSDSALYFTMHHIEFGGALLPDSKYSINGFAFRFHDAPTAGDTLLWHPYFAHRGLEIYECYIHDVAAEGLYLGHSNFEGVTVNVGGNDTTILPPKLYNIKIHDNIITRTGWDNMQLSNCIDTCLIYNNDFSRGGLEHKPAQGVGLVIGGGTGGDSVLVGSFRVFNNNIHDQQGAGIHIFGINGLIYNNNIANCGFSPLTGAGIFLGSKYNISDPVSSIHIFNNNITWINGPGIDNNHQYYNTTNMHRIYDNKIIDVVGNHINFQGGVSRNRWILQRNEYY